MSYTNRFNYFQSYNLVLIYIGFLWCKHRSDRVWQEGSSGQECHRKWSRIRLPVRPIALLGGDTAGCYGAQGDDNNTRRGELDCAITHMHAADLNQKRWLFQSSYILGAGWG